MKDEATEGADDRVESVDPGKNDVSADGGEAQASDVVSAGSAGSAESEKKGGSESSPPSNPISAPAPKEVADAPTRAASGKSRTASSVAKWAFVAVPLVALLELFAHVAQTHNVVSEADWNAARDVVEKKLAPEDLLLFAPKWEDPVGRAVFGDKLASLERTARPDESRFPRAIEVSARGKHRPELAGWKLVDEQKVGGLLIGTYENPHPVKILDDLRLRVSPDKMAVFRVEGGKETPCPFVSGRTQAGGLGAGPAIPGDRFQCDGGSFVGASIIHALDHDPRACLFAPPFGPTTVLRVRFRGVRFGTALHGHHGLQNEAERDKTGAPVTIVFRTDLGLIGRADHKDGMGWNGFELQTQELSGKTMDLLADITAGNANRRHYCFEADTR